MKQKLFTRNFSFIVAGQAMSMFGTYILKFTLSMYILDLTGSAAVFGTITAISVIPTILLSPFGGIMADRLNKRNLMVALDATYAVISLCMFVLLIHHQSVVLIGVIMVLLSIVSSFETPVVQSSIPQIVTDENLIRANAVVNQIAMMAGIIGPVLGGLLYGFVSVNWIILISGICFTAAALLEMFIHIPHEEKSYSGSLLVEIKSDIKSSLHFITKEQPNILKTMLLIASLNLVITSMLSVGTPYMIKITLALSSQMNGYAEGLMAAAGLIGGILAGVIGNKFNMKKLYVLFLAMGVALLPLGAAFMFGLSPMAVYIILNVCCVVIQIAACILSIIILSSIQQQTPTHLLGRIMAYVIALSTCVQPVGQAIYGVLFEQFSSNTHIVIFVTSIAVIFIGFGAKAAYRKMDFPQ